MNWLRLRAADGVIFRPSPRRVCWVSAWQALDGAGGDGADELGVVSLVLIGVLAGEAADRGGEAGPLADVAVDGHRVAGAGVGAGECLAARGSELEESGGDQFGGRDDLHVTELPHVVVLAVERAPADEDVGGALDQPFPVDHPGTVVVVAAGLSVGLIYRRPGLLDLQEQRVS